MKQSVDDEVGSHTVFRDVKYGVTTSGEAFVGVGEQVVSLRDVHFRDPKGRLVRLQPDEVAITRAVAYGAKAERDVVCVLSPFEGLGSSGSFQHVAVLLAVRKPGAHRSLSVAGAIVWEK
jgi:hypothetical protein